MRILKTYSRMLTNDIGGSTAFMAGLLGTKPHMRMTFGDWEIVGIGDILLVGGTDEALAPIRGSQGPIVVDNLDEAQRTLEAGGATITQAAASAPTGRYLYARHPDGTSCEYTERNAGLADKWVFAPFEAGKLSSEI